MADLNPLIRVRKHAVEQKQKVLSDLYRKAEILEGERAALIEDLETEGLKMHEMGVQMLSYFGPYSEAVKERIEAIDKNLKTLEARIQIAQDDMTRAFSDLKKVEIVQDRREEAEEKAQNKKESDTLDAIAIEGHRRKMQEEEE
ncbi:MAG: flagellar FliJ family protein [Alphaproteobacteria bacterium]|nr:flagellar FliJ family protein [Alphaproteobacteria bacterium]